MKKYNVCLVMLVMVAFIGGCVYEEGDTYYNTPDAVQVDQVDGPDVPDVSLNLVDAEPECSPGAGQKCDTDEDCTRNLTEWPSARSCVVAIWCECGTCRAAQKDCDDGDPCTTDRCNAGECLNTSFDPNCVTP